jgi:hypothetical protein
MSPGKNKRGNQANSYMSYSKETKFALGFYFYGKSLQVSNVCGHTSSMLSSLRKAGKFT